ncbi:hypothetical protein ABPG77_003232 [Micractinium sp. CCAP 211/92]
MDALREELEREGRERGGVIAGVVNWLGDAATSARAASPLKAAYQWLLRSSPVKQPESSSSLDTDASDLDPAAVERLQALLLGSRVSTVRLIRKCPRILEMEWGDLMARLVGMKELFPGCDVARMVELAPAAFLDSPWPATQRQLAAASTLLRRGLQGADVCFMFQEDPLILFEPLDSLEVGLQRMRELWPGLTPSALADSEPLHLSLAVKALGLNGPPKGF